MQTTPRSATHLPTLSLALLSGFGAALALLATGVWFVFGLVGLGGSAASRTAASSNLSQAWTSLMVLGLLLPSLVYSINRLRGKPRPAWQSAWIFRSGWVTLGVWLALLPIGEVVSRLTGIVPLLIMPPIKLLLGALPGWFWLQIGRRGLSTGGAHRSWALAAVETIVSVPLALIIEIFGIVLVVVAASVSLSADPTLAREMQSLAADIQQNRISNTELLRMVAEYARQPLVIVGLVGSVGVLAPMLEEVLKTLGLWAFARRRFTPSQGYVSGMVCGAVFALLETSNVMNGSVANGVALSAGMRATTALLHITCSGLMGWGLASAWSQERYKRLALLFGASVVIHGTWNTLAISTSLSALSQYNLSDSPVTAGSILSVVLMGVIFSGMIVLLVMMNRHLVGQVEELPAVVEQDSSSTFDPYAPLPPIAPPASIGQPVILPTEIPLVENTPESEVKPDELD